MGRTRDHADPPSAGGRRRIGGPCPGQQQTRRTVTFRSQRQAAGGLQINVADLPEHQSRRPRPQRLLNRPQTIDSPRGLNEEHLSGPEPNGGQPRSVQAPNLTTRRRGRAPDDERTRLDLGGIGHRQPARSEPQRETDRDGIRRSGSGIATLTAERGLDLVHTTQVETIRTEPDIEPLSTRHPSRTSPRLPDGRRLDQWRMTLDGAHPRPQVGYQREFRVLGVTISGSRSRARAGTAPVRSTCRDTRRGT